MLGCYCCTQASQPTQRLLRRGWKLEQSDSLQSHAIPGKQLAAGERQPTMIPTAQGDGRMSFSPGGGSLGDAIQLPHPTYIPHKNLLTMKHLFSPFCVFSNVLSTIDTYLIENCHSMKREKPI